MHEHHGKLGVTSLSDLQRALQGAGCAIEGMKSGRLDENNKVARRLQQRDRGQADTPVRCVEIFFPPIVISADEDD